MSKPRAPLVIVDYGLGNLFSISRALHHLGCADFTVTHEPGAVAAAGRLIIPGVGAFGDGMRRLRENGLVEAILEFARQGGPLLGICLGMQLLMEEGTEFGVHRGLGLIPGRAVALSPAQTPAKVPHVGWNSLRPRRAGGWKKSLLQGLGHEPQVYFVHSFVSSPSRPGDWLAGTRYAGQEFCSALSHRNIMGCQFHPEKSGPEGLRILANFLNGDSRQ